MTRLLPRRHNADLGQHRAQIEDPARRRAAAAIMGLGMHPRLARGLRANQWRGLRVIDSTIATSASARARRRRRSQSRARLPPLRPRHRHFRKPSRRRPSRPRQFQGPMSAAPRGRMIQRLPPPGRVKAHPDEISSGAPSGPFAQNAQAWSRGRTSGCQASSSYVDLYGLMAARRIRRQGLPARAHALDQALVPARERRADGRHRRRGDRTPSARRLPPTIQRRRSRWCGGRQGAISARVRARPSSSTAWARRRSSGRGSAGIAGAAATLREARAVGRPAASGLRS